MSGVLFLEGGKVYAVQVEKESVINLVTTKFFFDIVVAIFFELKNADTMWC